MCRALLDATCCLLVSGRVQPADTDQMQDPGRHSLEGCSVDADEDSVLELRDLRVFNQLQQPVTVVAFGTFEDPHRCAADQPSTFASAAILWSMLCMKVPYCCLQAVLEGSETTAVSFSKTELARKHLANLERKLRQLLCASSILRTEDRGGTTGLRVPLRSVCCR